MLSITHLVVSLLLIQLMNLDRNDAFIALVFGVFIDLDHLFGLKQFADTKGIAALLDYDTLMEPGGQWKSMFHNPVAVGIVAPLSLGFRLAIPVLFWGIHLAMDFAEDTMLGLFSAPEAMLLAMSALALFSVRYAKGIESGSSGSVLRYLRNEVAFLKGALAPRYL